MSESCTVPINRLIHAFIAKKKSSLARGRNLIYIAMIFLIIFSIYCVFVASADEDFKVTVGQDKTFTDFNYDTSFFENDPNNPLPWPENRVAIADPSTKTAYVSLSAGPGHAAMATSRLGVKINWNFLQYSWDDVKNWPVTIKIGFSYDIGAYWKEPNGSANALVSLATRPQTPYFAQRGREVGIPGDLSGSTTYVYRTNLSNLGDTIALQAVCQAHSAEWATSTHFSHAQVKINYITIEFFQWGYLGGSFSGDGGSLGPGSGWPIGILLPIPKTVPLRQPSLDYIDETEAWVKGEDNALWVNINENWYGKGGVLSSNPFAAKDYNGKTHVLVRGSDNAAWDFIYDPAASTGHWKYLGGYITEAPTAAMDPTNNNIIRVAAKGGDNALWTCDLDINTEAYAWTGQGGYLTSRPYILFDPSGKEHILVRGGDSALWDKKGVWSGSSYTRTWNSLGGYLASGPIATIEPGDNNKVAVFVKGGDNALWMCDVNSATEPEAYNWYGFGGVITSDPFAIANSAGNKIHTFVRGGDNALWENVFTTNPWSPNGNQWHGLGGSILHTPAATPIGSYTQAFVMGTDHALWRNTHATY